MQTISNAWRTDDLQTSRGHPLLKKASFAIYTDHFKRWRTDDYQCSQSSSQSSCRPSRQSSQSQSQPRDRLLRRDELPDLLLLLAMLPTAAPAMNSSAPFVPGDISYSLLRASSAAFLVSSISRTRASWRFMSASSLAQNSSRIRTCSSTSRASRSSLCSYNAASRSAFSRMRRISSLLRFRAYRTRAMPNMAIITIGMTVPTNVLLHIYIK